MINCVIRIPGTFYLELQPFLGKAFVGVCLFGVSFSSNIPLHLCVSIILDKCEPKLVQIENSFSTSVSRKLRISPCFLVKPVHSYNCDNCDRITAAYFGSTLNYPASSCQEFNIGTFLVLNLTLWLKWLLTFHKQFLTGLFTIFSHYITESFPIMCS